MKVASRHLFNYATVDKEGSIANIILFLLFIIKIYLFNFLEKYVCEMLIRL